MDESPFEPLGLVYPILFVLFVTQGSQTYHPTPIYTRLFAVGAVVFDAALRD